MVDEVTATLDAKARQMGFTDTAGPPAMSAVQNALADPDVANSDFGKAWTNMELVAQEGSWASTTGSTAWPSSTRPWSRPTPSGCRSRA